MIECKSSIYKSKTGNITQNTAGLSAVKTRKARLSNHYLPNPLSLYWIKTPFVSYQEKKMPLNEHSLIVQGHLLCTLRILLFFKMLFSEQTVAHFVFDT